MSFWEKAFKVSKVVASTLADEAQKAQGRAQQQAGKNLAETERQLKKYEGVQHRMTPEQKEKYDQVKKAHEQRKQNLQNKGVTVSALGEIRYGDYTYEQWNRKWVSIGPLVSANLTPYNQSVGLYRHKMNNKVVYIGRAIELNNGGFRKRLSDYRRESDSARKHTSGRMINENLNRITTDVLIVGDTSQAIEVTKELERVFVGKVRPEWNKMLF